MTTENANPEDLTDDQLEAAQRAADGEDATTNPPVKTDEELAAEEAAATAAAATAEGKTTTTDAAAQAGAEADGGDAKPAGIASKDGSRILPYGALQAERRSRRVAESRFESVTEELEQARQTIADLKAGRVPENGMPTEEEIAQMEEDFPEQGKKMRALFEANKALEAKVPAKTAKHEEDHSDDPVQEVIDQVPLLVEWQVSDAEKFERAQEHDRVLLNSPKWTDKPAVERFTQAARLTAEEFDIEFPEPKTSTTPKPTPSAEAKVTAANAPRATPNTLSDFKGGAVPDHGTADFQKMAPTQMLNRFLDMTNAEMDAQLAKLG